MRTPILCLIIVLVSSSFKPVGSGTAYLTCKSESGRTFFKAEIQDIDDSVENAELTVDGAKINFSHKDNSNIVFDSQNGVYTIVIENKTQNKFLKFWAIPKSFKTLVETSAENKYEFKAKIYSTEPRKGKELQTPEIELNCTLDYKI